MLIFDDNKGKAGKFCDVLRKLPTWTDDDYDRKRKQTRLEQIMDSTFSVRLRHAGLIPVANLLAFIFRRMC